MPSSIVHLFVAALIKERLNIHSTPQFYLGAISPDAVNLDGFASEKVRYTAHLRSKNVSEWLENIKDFAENNAVFYKDNRDFFKGFLVHLLTDIAWDEEVQPRLFDELLKNGTSQENLKSRKWDELFSFNSRLFNHPLWQKIKPQLEISKSIGISTIDESLLEKFKQKVLLEDEQSKISNSENAVEILEFSDIEVTASRVLYLFSEIFTK